MIVTVRAWWCEWFYSSSSWSFLCASISEEKECENFYEEANKIGGYEKEEARKKYGTKRLEKGPDGEYRSFSFTKNGETVSEKEGVKLRKEMLNEYLAIKNDPQTKKI